MNKNLTLDLLNIKNKVKNMSKKYGFSFSWKRLLGISGLKSKISRKTGIPLSKSGFERKIGRMIINILLKKK